MERIRILAIILCLTMVISVAGCSNTTNVQSKNQSQIVNVKNHKIKIKAKDWSEDGKSLVDVTYNGKYTGKMKKRSHLEKENLFLRMMIMLNGHILVNSKMAPLMVMVQQLGKKINMLKKKGSIQMVLSHQQR